jgi:hypothetical protein
MTNDQQKLFRWSLGLGHSSQFDASKVRRNRIRISKMIRSILVGSVLAVACLIASAFADACPFCSAVSQTFSEEMGTMDAVVVAELVELPPPAKPEDNGKELPKAKFKVTKVVKGESLIKPNDMIETIYFGDARKGRPFLIMGVDPQKIMWSTPLLLTDRARDYVPQLVSLPKEGPERLEFFQEYLEDDDEMLARDAYDEFAKAPYSAVTALKPKMHHDALVVWINNSDVPASRRRLYLTMLGVCGTEKDVPMLEKMLVSTNRKDKAGLDALIACYLTLKGPTGLELVEDVYLKNAASEYADTYAAIMAIRFHGSESTIIPKERLVQALRHMLDRPQLADLVIPDLARWEDWGAMDKMVHLFKTADEKSTWVRVPVINYLRACPKPEAKKYIEELEKLDPAAVKRANTFFPFGGSPAASPTKS